MSQQEAKHRYVVLRHDGIPDPHFDLMMETAPGALLMTWRSPEWPIVRETNLTKLGEHRRVYLEYEGEVSGGRGTVRRVAEGTCEVDWQNIADATVRFIAPPVEGAIQLKHLDGEHWVATPVS